MLIAVEILTNNKENAFCGAALMAANTIEIVGKPAFASKGRKRKRERKLPAIIFASFNVSTLALGLLLISRGDYAERRCYLIVSNKCRNKYYL